MQVSCVGWLLSFPKMDTVCQILIKNSLHFLLTRHAYVVNCRLLKLSSKVFWMCFIMTHCVTVDLVQPSFSKGGGQNYKNIIFYFVLYIMNSKQSW